MTSRAGSGDPKGHQPVAATELTGSGLGGRHSGHDANRPTFAGESRRKCPRSRSGLLERWVFGEAHVGVATSHRRGTRQCRVVAVQSAAASVDVALLSPQVGDTPEATASVRCLCNMPPPGFSPQGGLLAHRAHRFSRSRPARGERTSSRQGQRPATTFDFGRSRKPLGSGLAPWLAIGALLRAQARDCPGYDMLRQGGVAGRPSGCLCGSSTRSDCEDRQQRARSRKGRALSGELRQRRASPAAGRRRKAPIGPLPKVKSVSGPRGTGPHTRSLVESPVRHHGPGSTDAGVEGVRSTLATAGSPSLLPKEQASSTVRPSALRSPGSANQCAARCSVCRPTPPQARGCFTTGAETRFVSSFAETRFRAPWRCRWS